MKIILPLLVLCCGYLAHANTLHKTIYINLPIPLIEENDNFTNVTVENAANTHIPGHPSLPNFSAKIYIPVDKIISQLEVTAYEHKVLAISKPVRPSGHVRPLSDQNEDPASPLQPDPSIYNNPNIHPRESHTSMLQSLTGVNILIINIHPIQYYPTLNLLTYNTKFKIDITLEDSNQRSPLLRKRNIDIARIKQMVINPEDVTLVSRDALDHPPSELLIITNANMAQAFIPFARHKEQLGIGTTIATIEEIKNKYPTMAPATAVRTYLQEQYLTGTTYVLLGGDSDFKAGAKIPTAYFSATAEGYTDNKIPADIFFSNLDGDFDFNKNGILGEIGDGEGGAEVDLLSELFIGRVPVDTPEEVANWVHKSINYEMAPPATDYLKRGILAGEFLWKSEIAGDIHGYEYMEQLINSSNLHGYSTIGIPSSKYLFHRFYDKNNTYSISGLKRTIKNGIHLLNHVGHSSNIGNMKLTLEDIPKLGNINKYFFGYTQGCYAGSFDNIDNWGYDGGPDSFIEEMLITPKQGAFAYVGNTRFGWGDDHGSNGPGQFFHRYFWDGHFGKKIMELGRLNAYSKEMNLGRINDVAIRWTYYQLTLFGDPTLKLNSQLDM